MMPTLSTRPRPTPNNIPLILALVCGSWGAVSVGVYLLGLGALTLLDVIGGAL